MVDLGDWATERYRVPAEEQDPPGLESGTEPKAD
jgi:endogenous inhibitor of DNA gyrase (YacG/DUF329 family)